MLVGTVPPPKALPAPAVEEPRKRGRPRKEEKGAEGKPVEEPKVIPLFKGAKVWSPQEAEEKRAKVQEMLEGYFGDMDRILTVISHKEQTVWSNMSPDEMELLVNFALLRAQRSEEAARTLDIAMEYRVYVGVAAALLPRAYTTFLISFEAAIEALKSNQGKGPKRGRVVDASPF